MKDLTPVKFTPANDGATNSFMDPVSNDALNNSSALVAIKATGDVMLEKTYKTCIKPDGIYKGMLLWHDLQFVVLLLICAVVCDI